jgi:glycosidase
MSLFLTTSNQNRQSANQYQSVAMKQQRLQPRFGDALASTQSASLPANSPPSSPPPPYAAHTFSAPPPYPHGDAYIAMAPMSIKTGMPFPSGNSMLFHPMAPMPLAAIPRPPVMNGPLSIPGPSGPAFIMLPNTGPNPFVIAVKPSTPVLPPLPPETTINPLKRLFQEDRAVVYALNIRTFGANDHNGDHQISRQMGESGTFRSAIPRLPELAALGVNTIHLLPINPIGQRNRLGEGGSLYAPSDYRSINPEFGTVADARMFVQACHNLGIGVMVDIPSCASSDLASQHPELILKDKHGKPLVPTSWVDIVMFKNSPALQNYYEGFFDLMANQVGVDGFRADVARARTLDFWKHFTNKYPTKAWLAESYCEEDQSPMNNIPRDVPEGLMKSGFDAIYGQFHIFPTMSNAKEYTDYLLSSHAMFQRAASVTKSEKSFIGSFLTHDDPSLMEKGGPLVNLLSSGLMATQPWTNPYILDGFTTGFEEDFDIFRFRPKPTGDHPEIGRFVHQMLELRQKYDPVFTRGKFIPIPAHDGPDNQIISFARQAEGKTLLVVANKDLNACQGATLDIPGLAPDQKLKNLAPAYGGTSWFNTQSNQMNVRLAPGRFYLFEINTPDLAKKLPAY